MKRKVNWIAVIAIIALGFCVGYLIAHLIVKKMYIDALFAVAIVVLFPLLFYFIKTGKQE